MKSLVPSLSFASLALSSFCSAFDFDNYSFIHVPSTITAGVPFEARIDVEPHNGDTTYVHAYRIYLGFSPTEKKARSIGSDCYLAHELSICDPTITIYDSYLLFANTTITLTIPPTVGPSGSYYILEMQALQTDGSRYSTHLESNVFALENGTGEWGSYKSVRGSLWGADGIPCESYDCVRQCAEEHSYKRSVGLQQQRFEKRQDENEDEDEDEDEDGEVSELSPYQQCANSCPDVFIDPSSSVGGQPTGTLTLPSTCPTLSTAATATSTGSLPDANPLWADSTRSRPPAGSSPTGAANANSKAGLDEVLKFGIAAAGLAAFL